MGENHDYLLFGPPKTDLSLSAMHPGPPQVLKLWQIFMENVNPLLKLVHAPTLQTRIIDAVGNMTSIDRTLEALMFSIYCVTVVSLDDDDCGTLFSSPRAELLASYRPACQQALANATVLRSNERECLTALFLYLVRLHATLELRYSTAKILRFRSDPIHNLAPYHPSSASPYVSHSAWEFTMKQRTRSAPRWKQRCADDYGGRLLLLTTAFVRCLTT